jgi:hypothetical protein
MNVEKALQLKLTGGVGNAPSKGACIVREDSALEMGTMKYEVSKPLDVLQTECERS